MQTNQLANYQDIFKDSPSTIHLLLGNGFSIACDPIFKYDNILEFAKDHGLTSRVQSLFQHFGTTNFEVVARSLLDLTFTGRLYAMMSNLHKVQIVDDIAEIKAALISAIAETHLDFPSQIDETKRNACIDFLKPYTHVFTTNYDLLLYWCTMQGLTSANLQFGDGFRTSVDDPGAEHVVFSKRIGSEKGIFYLHGALHIFEEDGETRKHCWNRSGERLTSHVLQALKHNRFPLFVAEGTSLQKLEHIQRSGYLWYCRQKLQSIRSPLVVCGSSLGDSDEHIVNDIADSESSLVWLGVHGGCKSASASRMELVAQKLETRRSKIRKGKPLKVLFFDLSTANIWGDMESKKSSSAVSTLVHQRKSA